MPIRVCIWLIRIGVDVISFRAEGHENVKGTHASTFEITTDDYLTQAGDCILGINSNVAPCDLSNDFISSCQQRDRRISVTLSVDSSESVIRGFGHPDLTFDSERSFVFRTSSYIDDRTVMIGADKAAADINRELVRSLSAGKPVRVEMRVTPRE